MIKDIVVHLDGSADDELKISHSELIGSSFGAHLRGVYTNALPEMALPTVGFAPAPTLIVAYQDEVRAQGDRVEQALVQRFQTIGVSNELSRFDLFGSAVPEMIAGLARTADLFVGLRPYRSDHPSSWPAVVEAVLFSSGRGVYLVPAEATKAPDQIETVLIAWNDTRDSARALAEAVPFLEKATKVVIAMVDFDDSTGKDRGAGADILRHIGRYGVKADLLHLRGAGPASASLLNEVERLGADLVVLGGYGHSRFREWILGGVTRDFLTRCPVPMLTAH